MEVLPTLSAAGFQSELIVDPLELLLFALGFSSIVSPELDLPFFLLFYRFYDLDFDLDFDFDLLTGFFFVYYGLGFYST